MDRRKFLSSPVTNAAAAADSAAEAQKRAYLTNAVLTNHEGKKVRFYDDLLKDKITIVNMMYAKCDGICPMVTSNLKRVYQGLKGRIGVDTFMYSITLKPEQDSPLALKRFAEMHYANLPGWQFLTGDPDEIETIRFRLFRWDHPGLDNDVDQHTGMVFLFNDNLSRNCKTPAMSSVRSLLETISWMDPIPVQAARARRDAAKLVAKFEREAAWAEGEKWAKGAVAIGR
ncbi:MAG TPA: SCO family protein [Pyrinomonadaceae bacterium]|jgi:protein SCO1/2|nr:SCO family protein [Pyrinomonadaceae bacterium]